MKVLILGCSFSTGSHTINNDPDHFEFKKDPYAKVGFSEILHQDNRSNFWFGKLPEHWKIRCFSHSAGGYLNYMETLMALTTKNMLKDYDLCIIQESFEYRFTIFSPHNLYVQENFVEIDDNTELREINAHKNLILSKDFAYGNEEEFPEEKGGGMTLAGKLERMAHLYQFKYDRNMRRYLTDIVHSNTGKFAVMSSILMCNRLLEEHNIPTYAFRFVPMDFSDLHTHVKYLSLPPVKVMMWRNAALHNFDGLWEGHLTKDGQIYLATRLTNSLNEELGFSS